MKVIAIFNSKIKFAVLAVLAWSWILTATRVLAYAKLVYRCPSACVCDLHPDKPKNVRVDCTSKNLTSIPTNLDANTIKLDLSMNQITHLQERAFSDLKQLQSLHLVTNAISSISPSAFYGLSNLVDLYLQGNQLQAVPKDALRNLSQLELLYLDRNNITTVPYNSFKSLRSLKRLRLDANKLTVLPVAALNQAVRLYALDLENNFIEEIPDYAFENLSNLAVLVLSNNKIRHIGKHAFDGLQVLSLLELSKNRLLEIPLALQALPDLFELTVAENEIEQLKDGCFSGNRKLSILKLKDNPIRTVGRNTFSNMPNLEELVLSEVRGMIEFPNLTGTVNLNKITLDRASIRILPENLCHHIERLTVFDVHANHVSVLPNLSDCSTLTLLNLGNNDISSIEDNILEGLENLKDLILAYNHITYISDKAFIGLHKLQYLDLSYNQITYIHPNAFTSLKSIEDLNLGENKFEHLPTNGLSNLRHLKTYHIRELQEPPPYEALPNILTMKVAYSYHCCAFIRRSKNAGNPEGAFTFDEKITWLEETNISAFWSPADNNTLIYSDSVYDDYSRNHTIDGEIVDPNTLRPDEDYQSAIFNVENMIRIKPPVECLPVPNPFQPCDDLFGWWSLRCGVWVVFLLAVLGNATVLFVSLTSKSKIDVTRFLICNLALADLCMGIYLGFLAVVDASTLGNFETYAVRWQTSLGCLVAGFLGVLSSELSVFTLVVITVERFYAISHAIELGKRFRMGHASITMSFGWLLCIVIAGLPLFKISDYRKFAICLPFETENDFSLAYVCFIMIFNAISFIVILICYAGMFVSIRAAHSWNSNDTLVAKRMALLVFTDFFCWAPIIFFSLASAFEWNFAKISLDDAKVLTIFVLPLNSCANPFLYAFFTRQFKRDCVKFCKRIEESSISRHLSSSAVARSSNMNRHAQNNVVHTKRGSCDQLMSEASTSGETSNNASDDSDLTVKKLHLTSEEQNILKYVRSDKVSESRNSTSLRNPHRQTVFDSQEIEKLNVVPVKSFIPRKQVASLRKSETEDMGSGTDIVLHTSEGNVYLNSTSCWHKPVRNKSSNINRKVSSEVPNICAKRLCYHTLPKSAIPLTASSRSVESQTDKTVETPDSHQPHNTEQNKIVYQSSLQLSRQESAQRKFVIDRSKELGLQNDHFGNSSKLSEKSNYVNRSHVSTQTDIQLDKQLRHNLAAELAKTEKDKHINEWRKTSHLSFLWRNSGSYDAITQKQKSYSLVELTRPLNNSQQANSGKRHSLTSKQEGYMLLKNSSRDSAYEDDELYTFYDERVVARNIDKSNSERPKPLTDISNLNFNIKRNVVNLHVNTQDSNEKNNSNCITGENLVKSIGRDLHVDNAKLCETRLFIDSIAANACAADIASCDNTSDIKPSS